VRLDNPWSWRAKDKTDLKRNKIRKEQTQLRCTSHKGFGGVISTKNAYPDISPRGGKKPKEKERPKEWNTGASQRRTTEGCNERGPRRSIFGSNSGGEREVKKKSAL